MSQHLLRSFSLAGLIVASLGFAGMAEADRELLSLSYDQAGERLLKTDASQLFQSQDEGKSWSDVTLPNGVEKPALVVATVPAEAKEALYIAGPSVGVQRSDDNGETWQILDEDLPGQDIVAFAVHRNQPETLYAVVEDDGLYQSDDAGETWRKKDSGPTQAIRRLIHSDMEGSMETGWLYAVSDDAVRLSMDCFCGWRPTGELDAGKVYDVTYAIDEPERVLVATDKGLFRSDNGGQEWKAVEDTKPMVALASSSPETFYGLDEDGKLWRSDDGGDSWEKPDA